MLRPYLCVFVCVLVCVGLSGCLCVGRGCPVELACLIKLKYFGKPRNSFANWFSYSYSADADRRLSVPAGSRVGRGSGVGGQGESGRNQAWVHVDVDYCGAVSASRLKTLRPVNCKPNKNL